MPYAIQPGSIMEVIIWGELDDQVCMSTFYYKLGGTSSLSDGRSYLQEALTDINTDLGLFGSYADCCGSDYVFTNITAQWIKSLRYARVEVSPLHINGQASSPSLPSLVAAPITRRSFAETGRHAHGTLHMPAVPLAWAGDGQINDDGIAAYNILGTSMTKQIDGGVSLGDSDPVIYQVGNPPNSVIVDEAVCVPVLRTMRRRVVGRGI